MKKTVSLILCLAIILSCSVFSVSAKGKELIVFVTGIGQSYTYSFDEKYLEEGSFENGDLHDYENYTALIENGEYSQKWNLVYNVGEALKSPAAAIKLGVFLFQFIAGIFTGNRNYGGTVKSLASELFDYNIIDENGKLPENVITPLHVRPLSEYPYHYNEKGELKSEAKSRFYSSIPCAEAAEEKLGDDYEDYLYCFNYSAFSYTSDNVKKLHEFIETILRNNKVGADKVVLVPMSMGASVVSAYLNKYPDVSDNHVSRVVSIVGCWNGSDVVTDLLNLAYTEDSADKFYYTLLPGLLNSMFGDGIRKSKLPDCVKGTLSETSGSLILMLLRFLPKEDLRNLIDGVLSEIGNLILSTPSLLALVPSYDYMSIRERIPEGRVRDEADSYYECQKNLRENMQKLEKQGVTFSFISAYGSTFGGVSGDYDFFEFMASSADTNSDEIINISSTAPGTAYAPFDKTLEEGSGRILSPDKTIDISTTWYKDSTWFFYKEMHDLKYDNTALRLAVDLATGRIKIVSDCDSAEEDGIYYPQFNKARNIKQLNSDIDKFNEKMLRSELTEEQRVKLEKAEEMKYRTVNNPEADNKLIDDWHDVMIELNLQEDETVSSNKSVVSVVDFISKAVYNIFGAKGYFD